MNKTFILFITMLLSVGVYAQNTVLENQQLKAADNRFKMILTVTHADGLKEDVDSATTFSALGTMTLTKGWSLNARQLVSKVYEYDKYGGREFSWGDFRIGARYRFTAPPSFLSSASTDIYYYAPNSEESKDIGLYGRVLGRFTFVRSFQKGLISVGYQPYGMYYMNRYKQTEEGALNRLGLLGNNIFVSISPLEKLSFSGLVGFGQTYDEIGDFQQDGRSSNEGFVDIDLSTTYMILPSMSATLGYSHSESQVKGGSFEFYAFDPEVSSWYLSSTYTF